MTCVPHHKNLPQPFPSVGSRLFLLPYILVTICDVEDRFPGKPASLYIANAFQDVFNDILIFHILANQSAYIFARRCENTVISAALINKFS